MLPAPSIPGQQQRCSVPALPGPTEGVPGPAGGPGAAGPGTLPARERPVQPDHHVRAGVVPQPPEEAGAAGGRGLPRGGQFQHAVPQTGLRAGRTDSHSSTNTTALPLLVTGNKTPRLEYVKENQDPADMKEDGVRKGNV